MDEDERIAVELLSPDGFESHVAAGRIEDGKTLAAWVLFRAPAPPFQGPLPGPPAAPLPDTPGTLRWI